MSQPRYIVIMAGGGGERFWPQSRLRRPKHLLPIAGDKPMLAQTLGRLEGFVPPDNIFIITNQVQREAVLEVCPRVPPEQVVAEPLRRDTAAAAGLAMLLVQQRAPEAAFAILPADHVIRAEETYREGLGTAFAVAEAPGSKALVTIGVPPAYPATGYGYIHKAEAVPGYEPRAVHKVRRFVEKPDRATAEKYLARGEYYWNAGMFVWKAETIAGELKEHCPKLYGSLEKMKAGLAAGTGLEKLLETHYPGLEKTSIDYAVMEKSRHVYVVEAAFDWDDAGEWPAVARHQEADGQGNVTRGRAVVQDGKGNIIISSPGHLTALIGADDLIVVRTEDATLVCPKKKAQDIKKLVARLAEDPELKHWL